jgi:hypothetical protein
MGNEISYGVKHPISNVDLSKDLARSSGGHYEQLRSRGNLEASLRRYGATRKALQ